MESLQKERENQIKHEEEEMRKAQESYVPPPTITIDEIMFTLKFEFRIGTE